MMQLTNECRHIPIAAIHPVYKTDAVERKLVKLGADKEYAQLRTLYQTMIEKGPDRYMVSPSNPNCLDAMYERCVNFHPLIDELRGAILLSIEGRVPLAMDPILLLGPPGVGKTHFANMLGKLLGTGFMFVSMSQMTAGWILGGASSQWKGARKGKIAESLIDDVYANPVCLIDEIDKAGGEHAYDPMGTLYTLLEHDTASAFTDEYVEIPMDASKMMFIATANDERCIPKPILDRVKVMEVRELTKDELRHIARTMYAEMLAEFHWHFTPEMSDETVDAIINSSARTMRTTLMSAFRIAKLAGRDCLTPADLTAGVRPKQKIGF